MDEEDKSVILKAIKIFKKDKSRFQKTWLNLAKQEHIPLHEFMDFEAFIKSYFGCFNREAKNLVKIIKHEYKSKKNKID